MPRSLLLALILAGAGACSASAPAGVDAPQNRDEAVRAVLSEYPELGTLRPLVIPPQSIEAERYSPGSWLVAFVGTGQDRNRIIRAECFRVRRDGTVEETGTYNEAAGTEAFSSAICGPLEAEPPIQDLAPGRWSILGFVRLAAFSAPGSRDHDLSIRCERPARILITFHIPPDSEPRGAALLLRSGEFSALLPTTWNEMRASPPPDRSPADLETLTAYELTAAAALDLPPTAEFLRTGKLEVSGGGRRLRADAEPLELAALRTLLKECK